MLPALAAGTPAGLTIDNTAHGSFENPNDLGNEIEVDSNTVTLTVSEVAGIDVTGTGATEAPFGVANAGSGQGDGAISSNDVVYFTYTISNIGNDPTQFFIPSAPSNVINGAFDLGTTGPIEIIEYDDGVNAPVPITGITVPATGASTGTLLGGITGTNDGSVPHETATSVRIPSITVRIPIKVNSGLDPNTDTVTVVLGNTADADTDPTTFADTGSQNAPFVVGGESALADTDVFTQDNTGLTNGDATTNVPNPEREASDVIVTPLGTPSVDYGDAPDAGGATAQGNYETLPGRGPSHIVDNVNFLGTAVDADATAFDDPEDDGVFQGGTVLQNQTLIAGQSYTLDVSTAAGSTGVLNAWIDFNRDGDFDDPGEQVATNAVPSSDAITVTAPVPISAVAGTTFARFRYSTANDLDPTGFAPDGEVEDYEITIDGANPALKLVKRITRVGTTDFTVFDDDTNDTNDNAPNWPSSAYLAGAIGTEAEPGEEVDYTIYFLSDGNTPITNIRLCDYVPENTTYVANSLVMNLGSTNPADEQALSDLADVDDGELFSNTATPGSPCPATGNTDGGVFVRIPGTAQNATAPGSPTSSFGYIRFTVVVD